MLEGLQHGLMGKGLQCSWNLRGMFSGGLTRVCIPRLDFFWPHVHQAGQQLMRQALRRLGLETDGIGHAFAHRHALVGIVWRQIQHVASIQHPGFGGFEGFQNFQRQVIAQTQVCLRADAPATLAMGLQQKHVIAVEMRPNAAAIGGVADHQVIQAGVGHEAKTVTQGRHGVMVQIHALQQQGPVGLFDGRQLTWLEGSVVKSPLLGLGVGPDQA